MTRPKQDPNNPSKSPLDPRLTDHRSSRLRVLPTIVAAALIGTAASSAVEVTFQYYRFTPTKNRGGDAYTATQISEFEFFLRGTKVNHTALTTAGNVTGGVTHAPAGVEGVSKLVDGDKNTKWFDNNKVPVTFNFTTPTTIDAYRFATANDFLDRTPNRWTLSGSNDGVNFVALDDRTGADNAVPNSYFTFRPLLVTTPPAAAGLPVFSSYATTASVVDNTVAGQDVYQAFPAIVKNAGPSTSLSWAIAGTPTPTAASITPGYPTVPFTGTQVLSPITPDVFTPYMLTATTAAGNGALTIPVRAVPGGSATARYVRFTATSLRSGANLVQVAEFEFFNGATKLTGITASNPGGNTNNNANETADKIVDGNFRTKWLNHNNAPLVFDLGSAQTFDGYQLTTGNDAADRDPVRWVLETSSDGVSWSLLDNVYNYTPPSIRRAKSGTIPVSGIATYNWTGSAASTWDAASTSWVAAGTTTPAVALPSATAAVFPEAATNRDVTISGAVAPNSVSVLNTSGVYTFSGDPITGPGDFFKRGAGEVQLNSPNTFTGAIYLEGGKTVAGDPGALGTRDFTTRLQINDGAELHVMTDVTTDRRLRIGTGGGIVNVEGGSSFTKVGPVDFLGTLTKNGDGLLRFNGYQGSSSIAANDLVINEGAVEFTGATGAFNSRPFGGVAGDNLTITVNEFGILRLSVDSALGGDYANFQTSLEQLRIIGGTTEFNAGLNWIHIGLVGTEGRIVMQGGTITGGGQIEPAGNSTLTPTTFTILPSENSSIIGGTGSLTLNPENSTLVLDVANGAADEDLIITRPINGPRPLIKQGAGSLVLNGANGMSGPFTVSAGSLTLGNFSGSGTGTAATTLAAGTTLAGAGSTAGSITSAGIVAPGDVFNPTGTLTVGNTTLTGTLKIDLQGTEADKLAVNGTLNITGATMEITGTATESLYTLVPHTGARTGTFTVTPPSGYTVVYGANAVSLVSNTASAYDTWAAGLLDPAPDADPDADGITNLIEFVLDSNGGVSSPEDLPTATTNAQGDLVFTFVMKSAAAYLNPTVQYSTDLVSEWEDFAGAVVTPNTPSAGLSTVTATLPASLAAPGTKLFARLKAELP
ncbi:discoidin domain-containing protein [Luteolibacter sp. GHJ8]|uniref:Discoidin domain-containing protein n=1 Tax=Luteolibacter rhizosphaerae TaxID=2989719 RepID=A0ABT3G2U1_9BACT|nr:discoidin domain-containing protein [Luteolibacter rhizosphaerae]MCW1913801.1 discoidin domain-containing protein [Luteolibacter rhizosphaerae]